MLMLTVCYWVLFSYLSPSTNILQVKCLKTHFCTNAVGSAWTLLTWNTFGLLRYLSVEMFPKDEDSLIILFRSMSAGIETDP